MACKPGATAGPGPIRVVLVDDHLLFRTALKNVLESYADIEIVGEAADGLAALALIALSLPDIVCMDRRLPLCNGIDTTQRLRRSHPQIKVIGLSASDEVEIVAEILASGAAAYVSKQNVHDELIKVIRALHSAAV